VAYSSCVECKFAEHGFDLQTITLDDVLQYTGCSLQQFAEKIGDDKYRLQRVLRGEEDFGLTAKLATLAALEGLPPISR